MRQVRRLSIIMLLLVILGSFGCAANKYQIMYGIADWYYVNHVSIQTQYDASTPEQQAWLRKNVNPYMNIMQQVVIAMKAIDTANDVKLSACATEITRIATGVKYDAGQLVVALKTKNYDLLEAQAFALKNLITQKLGQKK